MKIERRIIPGLPYVAVAPCNLVIAHSTANPNSTIENEVSYMSRNWQNAYVTHFVGNGRIIQIAETGQGSWSVGGSYNGRSYAAVELIESHKTRAEFELDYNLYVQLLHELASEVGQAGKFNSTAGGVVTHHFAATHQSYSTSDHVDPMPYLEKWGITEARFKADVIKGAGDNTNGGTTTVATTKNQFTMSGLPGVKQPSYDRKGQDWKAVAGYEQGTTHTSRACWLIEGKPCFDDGKRFIPMAYTHYANYIKINYKGGFGVNALDDKGEQIKGSNHKFMAGTIWRWTEARTWGPVVHFKVGPGVWISSLYIEGGSTKLY